MASERDARRRAYLDKAAAEVDALEARGVIMGGNAFSTVLLAKGVLSEGEKSGEAPFSGADGTALKASLKALGYAPEEWEWLLTIDADGEPLVPELLAEAICALDPATLVCCDDAAASALDRQLVFHCFEDGRDAETRQEADGDQAGAFPHA